MKRYILPALKAALAIGLIAWLLSSGRLDFEQLRKVREGWPWLLASFALFGGVLTLAATRWRLLLRAQGIDYPFHDALSLTLIGFFFSQFIFGTTGGDVVKAYVVVREQRGRGGAGLVSVVFDRALGLFVLIGVGLVAIATHLETVRSDAWLTTFALIVLGLFVAGFVALAVLYSERVCSAKKFAWFHRFIRSRPRLNSLAEALTTFRRHPWTVVAAVFLSVALHVTAILAVLCASRALATEGVPVGVFFFLVPLANIAMAVPINPPGAIGTAEAYYAELFSLVGVATGGMIAVLMRVVYIGWTVVSGFFYFRRKGRVAEAVAAAESAPVECESPTVP